MGVGLLFANMGGGLFRLGGDFCNTGLQVMCWSAYILLLVKHGININ